jgi:neurobeachin-like protein 1/2
MSINEVHARNYHLMPTAIEIFIKEDGKTYFFNLYKNSSQQEFIRRIKDLNLNVIAIFDRFRDFQKLDYTERWKNGLITNFEYLMILNSYAGRSYNDINQYPVFPWILRDWDSPTIDFDTKDPALQEKIFRPLDCPMGALNLERRKEAIERYEYWENLELEPKFHYGSHYSNAASVIGYLIRLEPFTSLNMELQSGRFDQADRLFYSIKGAWNSCFNNRSDYRELVPEFFYLPDFLKNW